MSTLKHFKDPCVHCLLPHDEVPVGPCLGDRNRAVPMAFCSLGVRWDNVEHFRIRMSDDSLTDYWNHISMGTTQEVGYLHGVRYDAMLKGRK